MFLKCPSCCTGTVKYEVNYITNHDFLQSVFVNIDLLPCGRPPGILNQLKETFTHTPSYDMSPAMLSMLIRMMLAQAQECLFEKTALPGIRNQFCSLMKMAQEAAKVNTRPSVM